MMERRSPIEIRDVANGFMVVPAYNGGDFRSDDDVYVFGSFDEMIKFIDKHFSQGTVTCVATK